MTWHTLNGDFQTKGKESVQLNFFQYSLSKQVEIKPDVVEYDGVKVERPMFDLILGTKTMKILDFKHQIITIDEIELPMTSINNMPTCKYRALKLTNSLASTREPKSVDEQISCVVRILDANYKGRPPSSCQKLYSPKFQ